MADEKIPEFKGKEQFQPGTQPLPFGDAYRKLAENSNVLGKLGAEVAMSAAQQGAQLAGIKYGKDPKGNILPAFTKTDEAFTEAYRSTAYATLSIQADELMTSGVTTLLSSDGPLTQEGIDSFAANMLEGINDIADLAPDIDKEALKNKFSSDLINTQSKFQEKLINEENTRLKNEAVDFNNRTLADIFNAGANGDEVLSKAFAKQAVDEGKKQLKMGTITKIEFNALQDSARITYLGSVMYGRALKARKKGDLNLGDFLHGYQKNPMNWSEQDFIAVGQFMIPKLQELEAIDSGYQNTLGIEADTAIQAHAVTPQFRSKVMREGNEKTKAEFMRKEVIALSKNNEKNEKINFAQRNLSNASVLLNLDGPVIKEAFFKQAAAVYDNAEKDGAPISMWQAKTQVAARVGGSKFINFFLDEMAIKASSANPNDKEDAVTAFRHLNDVNPGNLDNLSEGAIALISAFEIERMTNDLLISSENVNKAELNKDDKSRQDSLNTLWQNLDKETFGRGKKRTRDKFIKGAHDVSGLTVKGTNDPIGLATTIKDMYERMFKALDGDKNKAKQAVKNALALKYQDTTFNGKTEHSEYMPLELSGVVTKKQQEIARGQVADQVRPQLENINALFNATTEIIGDGKAPINDFKYEFKDVDIPDPGKLDEIIKEITALSLPTDLFSKPSLRFQELKEKLDEYQSYPRPVLNRIYRDGTSESFTLAIHAVPGDNLYKGEVVYNVTLLDEKDNSQEFLGLGGSLINDSRNVVFSLDRNAFNDSVDRDINISAAGGTGPLAEMRKNVLEMEIEVENRKRGREWEAQDKESSKRMGSN